MLSGILAHLSSTVLSATMAWHLVMKDNAEYDHVARWATHLCNVESDRWYDIITNSNLMEYGTPPTPSIEY